jgi:hypothetical protein
MRKALFLGLALGCSCVGCGAEPQGASRGDDQAATETTIPDFADGTGGAPTVSFSKSPGVPSVEMRGPSKALQPAIDELTRQGGDNNERFTAATFKFPSEARDILRSFGTLKAGHACDLEPMQVAFDAMFFSLEPKRDGEQAHNSLDGDALSCHAVTAQAATNKHGARTLLSQTLKAFRAGDAYADLVDPSNNQKPADLAKLVQSSSTAVQSFLKDNQNAAIFSCGWGNGDDETASAVISIDAKSGEARVLFGFVGA